MAEPRDAGALFERLLARNREAFDAGNSSAASHILAGALHEAHARQHASGLSSVEQIAEEPWAWIDRTAPAYGHSTPSAATRGHTSIFTMLAHQAHAMLLMLQQQRTRAQGSPLPTVRTPDVLTDFS